MTEMTIGVSPQQLREVRFAEQWRGYRTDEVDELVERAADAFDLLEDRVREASERAADAERRLQERSGDDVSRTLVLAQRTADAALREAESEASRLVADAEEQARVKLAEVEARVARLDAEVEARVALDLHDLEERRRSLEADVELLAGYVERQRTRLADELRQHLDWLESSGHLEAAPGIEPLATTTDGHHARPRESAPEQPPPLSGDHQGSDVDVAVATMAEEARDLSPQLSPELSPDAGEVVGETFPGEDLSASADRGPTDQTGSEGADEAVDATKDHGSGEPAVTSTVMVDVDDDPFIAELRRAVDDPQPLGPRDEGGVWDEGTNRYNPDVSNSGRFRRRRHR